MDAEVVHVENQAGIYPTADKVLVLPAKVEEKTVGGIVIPQQTQDKENIGAMYGTVVAIGPAARFMAELNGITTGDIIVFARYSGVSQPGRDGNVYKLMRATDVLARAEGIYDTQLAIKPKATPFT